MGTERFELPINEFLRRALQKYIILASDFSSLSFLEPVVIPGCPLPQTRKYSRPRPQNKSIDFTRFLDLEAHFTVFGMRTDVTFGL